MINNQMCLFPATTETLYQALKLPDGRIAALKCEVAGYFDTLLEFHEFVNTKGIL